MTTLSDEEFQRLNNQLLELKVANYNLEASLYKSTTECSSIKGENERLKKQLAESGRSSTETSNQSIKSKLNPFALAKNIAHKVDAARHSSTNSQTTVNTSEPAANNIELTATKPQNVTETSADNNNLARRLESQEAEFLKTNETLKAEIALLQGQLAQIQEEKTNLSDKPEVPPPPPSSTYSPSRQWQQSLAQLTTYLNTTNSQSQNRQSKLTSRRGSTLNKSAPVDRFIDSLAGSGCGQNESTDLAEQKAAIEALQEATTASFTNIAANAETNNNSTPTSELQNTTEDFKQLLAFCSALEQAQQAEARQLVGELAREVVKHCRRQREVLAEEALTEKGQITADFKAREVALQFEIDQLRTYKAQSETTLRLIGGQITEIKEAKKDLADQVAQLSTFTMTKMSKLVTAFEHLNSVQAEAAKAKSQLGAETEKRIFNLQAELAEAVNATKISEKRGLKLIKELQRQLASERKRAEKLQSMILNGDASNGTGLAGPSTSGFANSAANFVPIPTDTTSGSSGSWSYMAESSSTSGGKRHQTKGPSNGFEDNNLPARSEVSLNDLEIVDQFPSPSSSKSSTSTSYAQPNGGPKMQQKQKLSSGVSASSKPRNGGDSSVSPVTLEAENVSLLSRVSALQIENWRLEELVNQLQFERAKLDAQLAEKNQLIEFYCIKSDGRASAGTAVGSTYSVVDVPTMSTNNILSRQSSSSSSSISGSANSTGHNNPVLRMVSFLKEKGEQVTGSGGNLGSDASSSTSFSKNSAMMDVNRKLQHMVEEILTKNMHLQANLEELSNQLMEANNRLKKYEN